jgi:hypothetical protein
VEAAKVPQHLDLGDVIAFGLGALDLVFVGAGLVVGWWLALALADGLAARLAIAAPFALSGVTLGIGRCGDRSCRTWLVLLVRYSLRARVLVTGSLR